MKKLIILLTATAFILVLGSAAMAGTMEVNVNPGVSFDLEHDFVKSDSDSETAFRINWGVNDKLCLEYEYANVSFDGCDSPHRQEIFGLRYEIVDGLAAVAEYKAKKIVFNYRTIEGLITNDLVFDSSTELDLGLRGKINLGENVDLVGQLTWNRYHYELNTFPIDWIDYSGRGNVDYSGNGWKLYTQVEFKIGEIAAINLGVDSVRIEGTTDTAKLIGAEFYCGKTTIYFDYYIYDDSDDNDLRLGFELGI